MGIRVHKVLGWGLNDVQVRQEKIIDSRFDENGYLFCEEDFSTEELIDILKNEKNENGLDVSFARRSLEEKKADFHDCVIYNDGKAICFTSFWNRDFHRLDDVIDYHEENENSRKSKRYLKDKVLFLDSPIYPFLNYIDNRDGRKIDSNFVFEYKRESNSKRYIDEQLVKGMGFNSLEECKLYITPQIPQSLILTLKYLKIFKDSNTIFSLKPMIFTFWR